jgi:acetoin:2,6-dichlorophenolindophenol oxidoreductase subunit alpha
VAVCFFGDGASNQGVLYETLNMAALWKLPLIHVCENNQFGEYSPWRDVTANARFATIGQHFGIPGEAVDGMEVLTVYEAACRAVDRARRGEGPSFIEAITYRFHGHHIGDIKTPYRSQEEIREWKKRDPVASLRNLMVEKNIISQEELQKLETQVKHAVEESVEFGKNSPLPALEEVMDDVYA